MYAYCFRIDTTSIEFASAISLTIAKPKPIEFTFEDFFQNVQKNANLKLLMNLYCL
jgi:hypothetical protein